MGRRFLTLLSVLLATGGALGQEEIGLEEQVEVRFVIIDALVVDGKGQAVRDLALDDFELYLDLKPHPIATVDLHCADPAAALDSASSTPSEKAPNAESVPPHRVVLVIDSRNLRHSRRIALLEELELMIRDQHDPGEEMMVVVITSRLRVEQPFTSERAVLIDTLRRMQQDPSLWRIEVDRDREEFSLFDGLTALIRTLSALEGSKALVLYSDLPNKIPDVAFVRPMTATPLAFDYDRQFDAVATAAMDARVALYPTHANRMDHRTDSAGMARLAVETGGRYTPYTNDMSRALVRAREDLRCRYTVGFYDRAPEEDRIHRVNLKVGRRGARVAHPSLYRFGSDDVARDSLPQMAYSAPLLFSSDEVRAQLLPLEPVGKRDWAAAVVIRFSVRPDGDKPLTVQFGAKLDDEQQRVVHAMDSTITVRNSGAAGRQQVVIVEPLDVAPGVYGLTVVVNDPTADGPRSRIISIEVPPRAARSPVLTPPILLQPAANDMMVSWAEEPTSHPLLPDEPIAGPTLTSLTRLCWARSVTEITGATVERVVLDGSEVVLRLATASVDGTPGEERCRVLRDELSVGGLAPGDYTLQADAQLPDGGALLTARTSFSVAARGDDNSRSSLGRRGRRRVLD